MHTYVLNMHGKYMEASMEGWETLSRFSLEVGFGA